MRNFLKMSSALFFILALVGCGEGSSSSDGSASSLYIETQKSQLNSDKSEMGIDFSVTNGYSDGVDINLKELAIKVTPCKIKQVVFSPSEVALSSSGEKQDVHAIVEFKNSCTPTSYTLQGKSLLTLDGKSNELKFNSPLQEVIPEENQTITVPTTPVEEVPESDTNSSESNESSADTINYAIEFSLENNIKFNLNEKRSLKVSLLDKERNTLIDSQRIEEIVITSKQENILKLFDGEDQSVPSAKLIYNNRNLLNIYAQTNTHSGLCDIDVEIKYTNAKGVKQNISKTYAVTVLSGPPTTFSINDDGVSYNFSKKWFEHKYLISASDKYNNLVNISPTIYVNAMTDFTKDNSGKPILYGKFGEVKGELTADKDTKIATFEANSSIFGNINYDSDYAIVFGDIHTYEALGKWDINKELSSDSALVFSDVYNGESHKNLGFAVGHNYMEEICDSSYREWHLKIDSTDGNYILDKDGETTVTVKYPAEYLYGKLGALSVNFLGQNPETNQTLKSGEVYFDVWNNVEGLIGESYKISKGTGTQTIRHYGIIDTGTGDKYRLKNSHFSCEVEGTNIVDFSYSGNNQIITDSTQCTDIGEASYIEYTVTADAEEDGSISFSKCHVEGIPSF
jgi:hypothetical protein